ncbi:MAG: hypothetical protein RI964_3023, partial [Pseudomonadota bacterium]
QQTEHRALLKSRKHQVLAWFLIIEQTCRRR